MFGAMWWNRPDPNLYYLNWRISQPFPELCIVTIWDIKEYHSTITQFLYGLDDVKRPGNYVFYVVDKVQFISDHFSQSISPISLWKYIYKEKLKRDWFSRQHTGKISNSSIHTFVLNVCRISQSQGHNWTIPHIQLTNSN